jgi:hypothetical protein
VADDLGEVIEIADDEGEDPDIEGLLDRARECVFVRRHRPEETRSWARQRLKGHVVELAIRPLRCRSKIFRVNGSPRDGAAEIVEIFRGGGALLREKDVY